MVLELELKCNSQGDTVVAHQYETHPMRASRPFRLDRVCASEAVGSRRAYVYLRNNSPGLFAGDKLDIALNLRENTQLYLTEQSASKVHPMVEGMTATVNYQWDITQQAMVEFVAEPLILYRNSTLRQKTVVKMHSTASLFWSDLILPGRLARGEFYQFRDYEHYLEVSSEEGELWFKERMYLQGKENLFRDSQLFASLPVLGNAIAILPNIEVNLLKNTLDSLENKNNCDLVAATSILPRDKGVIIRVIAAKTEQVKRYWYSVINVLRKLNNQFPLPKIPK